MSQQDEERRELKPCPCGETPTRLLIQADHDQPKYAVCFGDCCNEWWVEFRNQYCKTDSAETMERAIERWNAAPRRAPEHEKAAPTAEPVAQCNCGMGTASGQYHHDKCPRFNQFPDRPSPTASPPASDERDKQTG